MVKEERVYWNPEVECMPREKLGKLQWERLQRQLRYDYAHVPFYRKLWDEAGIKPDDIKDMDDFQRKVPTMEKGDLRKYREETGDPWCGILGAPLGRVRAVGTTTGTTGEHVFHPWTGLDADVRGETYARSLWGAGIRPGMRLWIWSPQAHDHGIPYGIYNGPCSLTEKLGVTLLTIDFDIIANFSGEMWFPELVIPIFKYCKPDVCVVLTELAAPAMEVIKAQGLDGHDIFSSVKAILPSAGLTTEGLRKTYQEVTGVRHVAELYSHGDLAMALTECREMHYCHLAEDLVLLEILDPWTKEPVAPGERGEITWTDLSREGYPLCRWMSEDIGFIDTEPCPCGRTHYRFKCIGRRGWIFKVKGEVWTPYDVEEEVLRKLPATMASEYYIVRYADDMDKLILKTTYDESLAKDEGKLREQIGTKIKETFAADSEVSFVKADDLPRAAHKVLHVVDEKRE